MKTINEHIKILLDLGFSKTKIADIIGISRQLMDDRLNRDVLHKYTIEERTNFYNYFKKFLT